MSIEIIHGDCRAAIEFMPSNHVHSIVTDPPYALVSISKRFSKAGRTPATESKSDAHQRFARGFMGKTWDNGATAFDPEFWCEAMRVLRPGGHMLAFGGTRTYHRLACAIEDAGFEIRDQIAWAYGSGFPKSHNMDGEWEGYGTALKPAWEPIVVARKPLDGTVAENLLRWGVGALNIDGCRVQMSAKDAAYIAERIGGFNNTQSIGGKGILGGGETMDRTGAYDASKGRWPANLIHDGSEEVLAAFPPAPRQIAKASSSSSRKTQNVYGAMNRGNGRDGEASANRRYTDEGATNFAALPGQRRGGEGSAARFFYCAKASKSDRNDGLDDFTARNDPAHRRTNIDTTGENRGATERKNTHPTVKPTPLMRYLCRLVTPPGGTVLDPFMGSGSTGRGAVLEGFNFIGCELDAEYTAIARARIAAAAPKPVDVFA